jgi:hypothetical protein
VGLTNSFFAINVLVDTTCTSIDRLLRAGPGARRVEEVPHGTQIERRVQQSWK